MCDKILAELHRYYHQHSNVLQGYESFNANIKKIKIDCFETLAAQDKNLTDTLIELAKKTDAVKLPDNSYAFFGLTSTGKSTILNGILGNNVAATGYGETTTEIRPYPGANFFIWDIPGKNDEVSYMTMASISFWKGLNKRLIVIQSTVKENSSMMKLMDAIGLNYDIVVNKLDIINQEQQQKFYQQIQNEIAALGLKRVQRVFFISAHYPNKFPDWNQMVSYLTNLSK
jgi:small GTP-binding protein